ncbi:MAG: hypothetical protein K2M12_03490 [Muribaculaceae bacterium]|nr:hypothetical protein [Muribaculaceae bacterium]
MHETRTYRVGDHLFAIKYSPNLLSEKELAHYAPFRAAARFDELLLFHLTIIGDDSPAMGTQVAEFIDENGRQAFYSLPEGGMALRLTAPSGTVCCMLRTTADYTHATARLYGTAGERRYGLDTALMMLYAFSAARHSTLLLHASAVEYRRRGYLFLGKSGTGKSTHSRLWTRYVDGASLLNDDNPVVRIVDGKVFVYGSPWSGKTPCYINRCLPIGAIVRLRQAPQNKITLMRVIKAYAALLPSCSCMKWDGAMADAVHATISRLIGEVPVFSLECLPDEEAARICCETITTGGDE